MNWEYISGFFDADGSITATKNTSKGSKVIQISFHNNELSILEDIEKFIWEDLGIKGTISLKKSRKETHQDSYDLKYRFANGYKVSLHLKSRHPKKKHRIEIYKLIQDKTNRNGKYTEQEKLERDKLLELFFQT